VIVQLFNQSWVQRWATYTTSQLWVSYRKGPLGSRLGSKPHPGDRIDDLACLRADGTRSRLHAQLGGQWAVLLPENGSGTSAAVAARALGTSVVPLRWPDGSPRNETWLVRPDAHLAWRGRDAAALERWLESALRTGRNR
jgi:hypothetical protein